MTRVGGAGRRGIHQTGHQIRLHREGDIGAGREKAHQIGFGQENSGAFGQAGCQCGPGVAVVAGVLVHTQRRGTGGRARRGDGHAFEGALYRAADVRVGVGVTKKLLHCFGTGNVQGRDGSCHLLDAHRVNSNRTVHINHPRSSIDAQSHRHAGGGGCEREQGCLPTITQARTGVGLRRIANGDFQLTT